MSPRARGCEPKQGGRAPPSGVGFLRTGVHSTTDPQHGRSLSLPGRGVPALSPGTPRPASGSGAPGAPDTEWGALAHRPGSRG